jgi:hypothetical protein
MPQFTSGTVPERSIECQAGKTDADSRPHFKGHKDQTLLQSQLAARFGFEGCEGGYVYHRARGNSPLFI